MAKKAPKKTPAAPKQVEGELLDAEFPGEFPADGQTDSRNGQSGAGSEAGTTGSDTSTAGTTQATASETENDAGKVAIVDGVEDSSNLDKSLENELSSRVSRLPGEGRSGCHERLRRLARAAGMPRGQGPGTAYNWAFEQTDRLFSELSAPAIVEEPPAEDPEQEVLPTVGTSSEPAPIPVAPAPVSDGQDVSGLSDLPPNWPELPANAQLQVEIAWVTANRLRVRDGTGVNLSKALSPAPSYSALSWLETSILFPAKFADISVKATATQDDEREFIRREKLAIEEIRSILAEMLEAEG